MILLAVLALVVSACGPAQEPAEETVPVEEPTEVSEEPAEEEAEPTEEPAEEEVEPTEEPVAEGGPVRGGVLKHALPPLNSLDPAFLSSVSDDQIGRYWHDFLVYVDETSEPIWERSIATGYEVNEEGTVWTFDIRENVTFHDGRPLTAEDIVFTFDRLRDPEVGAATVDLYSNMVDVEAVDDYTVRFTLERPNPDFITYDLNDYHALIMDKETEDFETEWNGTGPFMIEEYIPEDRLVMTRNPNYWMKDDEGESLPYLDGYEFIFLSDPSAQVEALQGGQVHWINYVSPEFVDPLEADPEIIVHTKAANTHYALHMRADQPPTDDVRVRQAIKAATDNQEILDVVGLGYGRVGNNSPIGPAFGDFYLEGSPPERDLERAQQLLAEAGYEDGLEIELTTMDVLAARNIATVWAEQLAEAGITVDIQVIPVGTYYGDGVWLECQFGITDWGARNSPQPYLQLAYTCNAPWNSAHWCDEELDELARAAGSEMDHEERVELYHEIQRVFADRGPVIVPYFVGNLLAYRDSVKPELKSGAISTDVDVREVWLEE